MKHTFSVKKDNKIKKIIKDIKLNIDMEKIPEEDIYGYYIMNEFESSEVFDIPMIGDFHDEFPDYIALFNHPKEFNKTLNTCVGFYIKDKYFDEIDGLYQAIIYKDIELLKYYKFVLKDVKFLIAPDYSMYGNFKDATLIHQLEKQAIVFGWMKLELNVIVYPNITYGLKHTYKWCFKNIYKGSNVALSLKGCIRNGETENLINAIKFMVNEVEPKTIIVYSVSCDETSKKLLSYAIDKGINVIFIPNELKIRNLKRSNNGQEVKC